MKILIVGAGVAGITAGHILAEHGVDFEIFEASATYGGRVRKVDDFVDFPIDLGAEWIINGSQPSPPCSVRCSRGQTRGFLPLPTSRERSPSGRTANSRTELDALPSDANRLQVPHLAPHEECTVGWFAATVDGDYVRC